MNLFFLPPGSQKHKGPKHLQKFNLQNILQFSQNDFGIGQSLSRDVLVDTFQF